ncbi:MAG TPA: hypothetical protein VFH85_02860 [Gammaproteobacteria bacterium]|nr:hypothetical protein [Gammaproteobacteria bacterium]
MKTIITASLVAAIATMYSVAMAEAPTQAPGAMAKLAFLVGTWQGDGWIVIRGQRHTFQETETVTPKLGGTALLIQGSGVSTDAGNAGEPIHNALAVASYDRHQHAYRWYALQAGQPAIDTQADVSADTLTWHMTVPHGGKIRFVIKLNDKQQWHEIGEFSSDGKTWHQFFEMTLDRQA